MMRKRNPLLATILALVAAAAAGATTLVRMDLDELAAAAPLIVRVRCVENEARADGNEIWTFTRFEVVEALKGTAPREVTVRLLGGRVGHVTARVDGVPRFAPGEETYLFLEPTRSADLSVTGWVQGTFRIQRDPPSGSETVTQDTSSVTVFDPATRQFSAGSIRKMPVAQFREQVRHAIERTGRRP